MFEFNAEKNYPKETESRVLIRFQDCDPLRHLNNAKYFDYFFNAREDQVPKLYGVEMMDFIKKYKAAWVIYNHNISYVKPAMVGEWVRIKSRILWHNHNTVILEYFMTDDNEVQLKTLLWTTMRYVTLAEGKSTDHEGAVDQFLTATSMSVDISGIQIKERVKALIHELK
ncbi:acyl-CoA thioester hydrolase [Algoriphagus ratkowskyi]|uniref:Acyl-CoA thioester hydrolase n=1 Tax=Algoriphagus ratkowskyi TaxID=57028 RepID=A0A2W7R8R6_9BACT|nr:acyl-CoA thioesterase [Algoriphagus ratkowskyi]PZX55496.1 acyl-CoA thioester hydrolase [Algoriphagus ratkowskyi]TXD79587.1 acyl-CoA thioesterase [Algoriphagus ratkowskyi]